jgi:hypothetical protein
MERATKRREMEAPLLSTQCGRESEWFMQPKLVFARPFELERGWLWCLKKTRAAHRGGRPRLSGLARRGPSREEADREGAGGDGGAPALVW